MTRQNIRNDFRPTVRTRDWHRKDNRWAHALSEHEPMPVAFFSGSAGQHGLMSALDHATRLELDDRRRNSLRQLFVGAVMVSLGAVFTGSGDALTLSDALVGLGLIPLCGGAGGLWRNWRWRGFLARHEWQRVKVKAGFIAYSRGGRELFLLPKFSGQTPYALGWTWARTADEVHRDGYLLIAGDPGETLLAMDPEQNVLVKLHAPRSYFSRTRWGTAFIEPDLAQRDPLVRGFVRLRRRLRD